MDRSATYTTIGRTAAALAIAVVFMGMLMLASAQQAVVSTIARESLKVDYNSAVRMVRDSAGARQGLAEDRRERRDLALAQQRANADLAQARSRYSESMGDAGPVIDQVASSGQCEPLTQVRERPGANLVDQWRAVQACLEAGAVPGRWRPQIERIMQSGVTPATVQAGLEGADSQVRTLGEQAQALDARILAAEQRVSGPAEKLEVVNYLLNLPLVDRLGLVDVPPAMMQIIFSFVSGLFGALLITLILAVYPNNNLQFSQSSGYYTRLFLGGLIAVCVFVIIGGGIAIVETDGGVFRGEANYLSFCAIGVLAGMFSDRVAVWISHRATLIFSTAPPHALAGGIPVAPARPDQSAGGARAVAAGGAALSGGGGSGADAPGPAGVTDNGRGSGGEATIGTGGATGSFLPSRT